MTYGRMISKYAQKFDSDFTQWLYGSYDKQKLDTFEMLYATPLKPYIDYKLDKRADEEYLRRYAMNYTDIHDPRKLRQTSSAASFIGQSFRMVSRNLEDLYPDDDRKKKGKK